MRCLGGVESLEDDVFSGCDLRYIELPSTIKKIGIRAFAGCAYMTAIVIPDSVTYIDNTAFEACSSLAKIDASDEIKQQIESRI